MFRILAKSAKRAEILIYGDIGPVFWGDEVSAADFAKTLKEAGDVDEIDLRINSLGGHVFDGVAIYQQLSTHPAKINVRVDGIAASIASVIAMAGDRIEIAEAGMMMIHDAGTIVAGNAERMRKTADLLDKTSEQIAEVYVAKTGKKLDEIRTAMRAETWLTGKEAVEFGLADAVIENKQAAENVASLKMDAERYGFSNPPAKLVARHSLADMVAKQQVSITMSRIAAKATTAKPAR